MVRIEWWCTTSPYNRVFSDEESAV